MMLRCARAEYKFYKKRGEVYGYGMINIKANQSINIMSSIFECKYIVYNEDEADPCIKHLIREKI